MNGAKSSQKVQSPDFTACKNQQGEDMAMALCSEGGEVATCANTSRARSSVHGTTKVNFQINLKQERGGTELGRKELGPRFSNNRLGDSSARKTGTG